MERLIMWAKIMFLTVIVFSGCQKTDMQEPVFTAEADIPKTLEKLFQYEIENRWELSESDKLCKTKYFKLHTRPSYVITSSDTRRSVEFPVNNTRAIVFSDDDFDLFVYVVCDTDGHERVVVLRRAKNL
jgi:hypothetical protein